MIASVRGLVVLAVIAVACAVLASVGGGEPTVEDRAVVAGLDADAITELKWQRGDRTTMVTADHGHWRLGGGFADTDAIDRVKTALRGGRWHRAGEVARAGKIHATLEVYAGAATTSIGIGDAAGEQAWLVVDGRALLVDGWLARALDLDAVQLMVRHPFRDAAGAATVKLVRGEVTTEVDLAHARLGAMRLDPAVVENAVRVLADLAIVRVPDHEDPKHAELAVTTTGEGGTTVTFAGECSGAQSLITIHTAAGAACVPAAQAEAIEALAVVFAGAPDELMDRRPAGDAVRVTLLDGSVVEAGSKRPTVGGEPADPDRVAELVAALATQADLAPVPAGPARGKLVVVDRGGAPTELELRGDVLVIAGQPRALKLSAKQLAVLTESGAALKEVKLWVEEPTTISAVTVGGKTFTRGAVIGEWSGGPADKVEALVAVLANPRVEAGGATIEKATHVSFTTAPPVGKAVKRELEVDGDGVSCAVRFEGKVVRVQRALCDAVGGVR